MGTRTFAVLVLLGASLGAQQPDSSPRIAALRFALSEGLLKDYFSTFLLVRETSPFGTTDVSERETTGFRELVGARDAIRELGTVLRCVETEHRCSVLGDRPIVVVGPASTEGGVVVVEIQLFASVSSVGGYHDAGSVWTIETAPADGGWVGVRTVLHATGVSAPRRSPDDAARQRDLSSDGYRR